MTKERGSRQGLTCWRNIQKYTSSTLQKGVHVITGKLMGGCATEAADGLLVWQEA
jgi:hypothetical protein